MMKSYATSDEVVQELHLVLDCFGIEFGAISEEVEYYRCWLPGDTLRLLRAGTYWWVQAEKGLSKEDALKLHERSQGVRSLSTMERLTVDELEAILDSPQYTVADQRCKRWDVDTIEGFRDLVEALLVSSFASRWQ
jgi:hypothetical protein